MDYTFSELKEISRKIDELYYMFSRTPEEAIDDQIKNIIIHFLRCYMYGDETNSWNYWTSKELIAYLLPVIKSKKSKKYPTGDQIIKLMNERLPFIFDVCYRDASSEKESAIKNKEALDKSRCVKFIKDTLNNLFKGNSNKYAQIDYTEIENALLKAGAKKKYSDEL